MYSTHLTNFQWQVMQSILNDNRKHKYDLRSIMDAILCVGYLHCDSSKPDGTPQKLLNIDRLKTLGFVPKISLKEGIQAVYNEFKDKYQK